MRLSTCITRQLIRGTATFVNVVWPCHTFTTLPSIPESITHVCSKRLDGYGNKAKGHLDQTQDVPQDEQAHG